MKKEDIENLINNINNQEEFCFIFYGSSDGKIVYGNNGNKTLEIGSLASLLSDNSSVLVELSTALMLANKIRQKENKKDLKEEIQNELEKMNMILCKYEELKENKGKIKDCEMIDFNDIQ
jgi:hypothetical protein